jgi:hypothetical protein
MGTLLFYMGTSLFYMGTSLFYPGNPVFILKNLFDDEFVIYIAHEKNIQRKKIKI